MLRVAILSLLGVLTTISGVLQAPTSSGMTGVWRATYADSLSSGTANLKLEEKDGTVAGTFGADTGGLGTVAGRFDGHTFSFTLAQKVEGCPGTFAGTLSLENGQGRGTYSGSDCLGKHENGVISLVRAATEEAPGGSQLSYEKAVRELSTEEQADRVRRDAECPGCPGVILYYVEAESGKQSVWWLTESQDKWLKQDRKNGQKKRLKPRFWFTRYEANADYFVFWSQAEGYQPYIYRVPRTQTDKAQFSGTYNTRGSSGYSERGSFSGDIQIRRTYYERVEGVRTYLDVFLNVYDARTGEKVYETWHQGNWLWSKPDKDCLVDAMKFLRSQHP